MASNQASVDLTASRAGSLEISVVICTVISGITVLLRLYTRWAKVGRVFLSDYCIILGLLGAIGMAICIGIQIQNGFGRHVVTVTSAEVMQIAKMSIGAMFFFHWCHMTIKASILLQYLRICVMPFETRLVYGAIFIVVGEGIGWLFTLFLTCIPFEAMWNPHVPAKCINNTAGYYAAAATSISADIAILIFPVLLLRHSLLPWPRKLAIGIVLAFGGAACIVSILRVRYIWITTNSTDPTWDKMPNTLLGDAEINLGIICSSVVTLRPLIGPYIPKRWRTWLDSRQGVRPGRLTITGLDTKPGSWSESEGAPPSTRAGEEAYPMPDVERGSSRSNRSEAPRR